MVEVEIYMNNLIKFFKNNPNDLINLIPENKKEVFFEKIRFTAIENLQKGKEVPLTQQQMVQVCLDVNDYKKGEVYYQETKFGKIYLN